ncbi:MAG: Trk system potassium transporter TrkA [Magnetococcales bacterium]|nr:Trk system potassium transporter TrkA [Magnetococcales bacterium]
MAMNRMHVVIFGAGLVGAALGRHIAEQGHDVCFIESNPEIVHKIQERMDVQIVQGAGEDPEALREAGVERADLILAVTNLDKSNIILTLIARSLNPRARIITRVKEEEYLNNRLLWQTGGLADTIVISPERAVIDQAMNLLDVQQAVDVAEFLDGQVRIAGFRLEKASPLVGKSLREMAPDIQGRYLVVAVDRDGTVSIPTGAFVVQPQDLIFFAIQADADMRHLLGLMGKDYRSNPKFVIVGGGPIGMTIAQELEKKGRRPVMIEPSMKRCQELAGELHETVVLHGDVTDSALLQRVIDRDTIFLSVTETQEVNFLVSMLSRKLGAVRAVTLMDNEAYLSMGPSLGVDAIISPRLAAVGTILRFVRMGRVLDSAMLLGGAIDLFLVEVEAGSRLDGVPLKKVGFHQGMLVAAAVVDGKPVIPDGDLVLKAGDKALLATHLTDVLTVMDELIAARG